MKLPIKREDGLLLRWATADDIDEIIALNMLLHSDPNDPEENVEVKTWSADLLSGKHPTTSPNDFTVVVDQAAENKIVSTLCTIAQTWRYEEIPFSVGRPELVGTLPEYRRRGLVRWQMDAIHARALERGEQVQAITGIPWYYRQFEYGMALDLHGSRQLPWSRLGPAKEANMAPWRLRPVTVDDVETLAQLYEFHCQGKPISRLRTEKEWLYEMDGPHERSIGFCSFHIIEHQEDGGWQPAGYTQAAPFKWIQGWRVTEIAVFPAYSLRAAVLFIAHQWHKESKTLDEKWTKPSVGVTFSLGAKHAVYDALEPQLTALRKPYAWYIRVANLPNFLRHIAPVLERRLAASVMAGHTGTCRLNLVKEHILLSFEKGKLTVGTFKPDNFHDGDALYPDYTFLQLLFGHASRAALNQVLPDAYTKTPEHMVLLDILFPTVPSYVNALN